jgi:hypothetical protein
MMAERGASGVGCERRCSRWLDPNTLLSRQRRFTSRLGEDWWTYANLFRQRGSSDTPGVYVEVGAGDFLKGSSSFVFDRCLGWSGLCVEPDSNHWAGLQRFRTCQLAPVCVTSAQRALDLPQNNRPLFTAPEQNGTLVAATSLLPTLEVCVCVCVCAQRD